MSQHFIGVPIVLKAPVDQKNMSRHLKQSMCMRFLKTKVPPSLSPELYSLVITSFSHGCRDVFSLEGFEQISIIIWNINLKTVGGHIIFLKHVDLQLAHTPWEGAWQPCFQTSWPHRQESLVLPRAEPWLPPHPFCWPETHQWEESEKQTIKNRSVK